MMLIIPLLIPQHVTFWIAIQATIFLEIKNVVKLFVFVHIYPPFTRKRIVSLCFERDVRTRLGVAIFEVSGPSVFHIKTKASR